MGEIVQLKPCANAPTALRNIADQMESGEIEADEVTLVAGVDIFHCGEVNDERAIEKTIFNLNYAIHKLMNAALSEDIE